MQPIHEDNLIAQNSVGLNLDQWLWHDYNILNLVRFCLSGVNLSKYVTLIIIHIMGHTIEHIFTVTIVGLIL